MTDACDVYQSVLAGSRKEDVDSAGTIVYK